MLRDHAAVHVGITRVWAVPEIPFDISEREKFREALLQFYKSDVTYSKDYTKPLPYIDLFPGQILNLKKNFSPRYGFHNNAKVVVVSVFCLNGEVTEVDNFSPEYAVRNAFSRNPLRYEILVKFLANDFKGPSAHPDISGVFLVPWTGFKYVKKNNVRLKVTSPFVHPANAISSHQSQGATFPSVVSTLDHVSERYYGMANVVMSRTSDAENFALTEPVSLKRLMPKPETAQDVEEELLRIKRKSMETCNNWNGKEICKK